MTAALIIGGVALGIAAIFLWLPEDMPVCPYLGEQEPEQIGECDGAVPSFHAENI